MCGKLSTQNSQYNDVQRHGLHPLVNWMLLVCCFAHTQELKSQVCLPQCTQLRLLILFNIVEKKRKKINKNKLVQLFCLLYGCKIFLHETNVNFQYIY